MYKLSRETLTQHIVDAFDSLEFKPRGNQIDIIYEVLDAFLNQGKKSVVLNAGTGVGKSIIGAVVSTVISNVTDDDELASCMLTGTNILAKQYHDSFSGLDDHKFFAIKGASNYSCAFMEKQPAALSKTAEECVAKKLSPEDYAKNCRGCEYAAAKKKVNVAENLITNYSYFFVAMLASGHLKPRKLHIFDEAHLMNEQFCNYTEINIESALLDKYIKELSDANGKCDNEAAGLVMVKQRLKDKSIGESNYKEILTVIGQIYVSASKILGAQATLLETIDIVDSSKYAKLGKKFESLGSKITDLFDNDYDHVFDDTVDGKVTVKTIFVDKMMSLLLSTYNLFMSATITENFAHDTLGLSRRETTFVQTPPSFPPENKPLFFIGKDTLNYNSLKDQDVINDLKRQVGLIVNFHKDQKGLIISPSFYLGSQLAYNLRGTHVFEHKTGVNLPDLVSRFKAHKGSAVLVSPSIYEGLDFSDDDSRFQIIVKSPFPPLGDKRIKYIADNYPTIYKEMTLLKILQAIGRSIRSPEDFAATYFLDKSSGVLYNSNLNIWKDHYKVMKG